MTGFVLDHLWQSTLFAAAAGLLTLALRGNAARIRYYVWFVASVKFLIPFALLSAAGSYLLTPSLPRVSAPSLVLLKPVAQPFSMQTLTASAIAAPGWNWAHIVTPLLLALWVLGFAAIMIRWLMRWSRLQRVVRQAADCSIAAPVPVKMAASMLEPGLVGIWRPVILLPQDITEYLAPEEMDAILAHEICHLSRRDNLLAATHMLVEALFWFHPLVWWLGARLNEERELACDEAVLAEGRSPRIYAESILKVCQLYLHSPLDCAAGISGADLKIRMETIMEARFSSRLNNAKKLLLAGAAMLAIAAPVAMGLVAPLPVLAQIAGTPHDPRTEAALRGQIEGFEKHQPAFAAFASGQPTGAYAMQDYARRHQRQYEKRFDALGALKSVTFKGVADGTDYYIVEFANGRQIMGINLTPDGKIGNLEFVERSNPSGPEPGTEAALRQFINGIAEGQPAYDLLTPDWAKSARANGGLGKVLQPLRPLGALKSLAFQKVTTDGQDQYQATYEHGRSTWTVGPLIGGKLVEFGFSYSDPGHGGRFQSIFLKDADI